MRTQQLKVTPSMARSWLAMNNNNRNLRKYVVDRYAADMAAGRWEITHQGIAVYEDGTLADGQHRLSAVVKAGVTVPMLVTFDIPRSAGSAVDTMVPREVHDALRIGGAPTWLNKDVVAVTRAMMDGFTNCGGTAPSRYASPAQIEEYARKYEEPIRFAVGCCPQKRRNLTPAAMQAVYACARYHGEPANKIERFAQVMLTGEIRAENENAAIRLREYLLFSPIAWTGQTRFETARRANRALQLFIEGKSLSKLYAVEKLSYPPPAFDPA